MRLKASLKYYQAHRAITRLPTRSCRNIAGAQWLDKSGTSDMEGVESGGL